jgi:hypothetical protein
MVLLNEAFPPKHPALNVGRSQRTDEGRRGDLTASRPQQGRRKAQISTKRPERTGRAAIQKQKYADQLHTGDVPGGRADDQNGITNR